MLASSIPVKFALPFAANATGSFSRQVPTASQLGITPGAASMNDGFPPLNFIDTAVGGIPPDGKDFNGILNQISAWSQWQNAGGIVPFDAAFSTAIAGYPKGATIAQTPFSGNLWLSIVDNNITNPDTGGAGWLCLIPNVQQIILTDTGNVNVYTAVNKIPLTTATLVNGTMQTISFTNGNTGSSTYSPDGLTAKPIYNNGLAPLLGADIAAKGIGVMIYYINPNYNSGNGIWVLLHSTGALPRRYAGVFATAGALTGIAAHIGGYVFSFASGSPSYSLPNIVTNNIPIGATVHVTNAGQNSLTLVPQGTDAFQVVGGLQIFSLLIPAGGEIIATYSGNVNLGHAVWFIAGSGVYSLYPMFKPLANGIGYEPGPGGILKQWGNSTTNSAGTANVAFAFPYSSLYNIQITTNSSSSIGTAVTTWGVSSSSLNSFNVFGSLVTPAGSPSSNTGFYWFAIGLGQPPP